jgi:16S rRNA (cytidine1402-2'-O)-methyltransferase
LSVNKQSRKEHIESIKNEQRTLIFYEAPHKLLNTLKDLHSALGDRNIAVVKEITKLHETVLRLKFSEAIEYFSSNAPRGEYVLIIEGKPRQQEKTYTIEEAVEIAKGLIEKGLAASAAAKEAASVTGFKKGEIYSLMLK